MTNTEYLDSIEEFFNYFIDSFIINKIVIYTNKRLDENVQKAKAKKIKGFYGALLLLSVLGQIHIEMNEIYNIKS